MDAFERELLSVRLEQSGQLDEFLERLDKMIEDTSCREEDAWEVLANEYGGAPKLGEFKEDDEILWRALSVVGMEREATPREEATWVMSRFHVPIDRIDPEAVPSAGAVTMLRWAKGAKNNDGYYTSGNLTEFMKSIYAKLMPTRSELEELDRFKSGGRILDDTLDEVTKAFQEATQQAAEEAEMTKKAAEDKVNVYVSEEVAKRLAGDIGDPI